LGRTVGFAGRVLGDDVPKYLNTPETDLFDKGSLLYGLDRARPAIREAGEVLVVEGYMDVLALHQTGFETAVAALGATLTEAQAQAFSRLGVQRVRLAFDADEAGQRAVLSGLDQSVGRRFLVEAVTVPSGKDPADAVLDGDVEAFRAALAQGQSEVAFRFRSVVDGADLTTPEGRREVLETLAPSLTPRDLHDEVAAEMRRLVVEALDLDEKRLLAWLESRGSKRLDATQVRGLERRVAAPEGVAGIEVEIMALLLREPGRLAGRLPDVLAQVPSELEPSKLREFAAICAEEGYDPDAVLARYREREEGDLLFARAFDEDDGGQVDRRAQLERHLETSLARLRERVLERGTEAIRGRLEARVEEIRALLAKPDLDDATLQACYAELTELQGALAAREAERRVRARRGVGGGRRR
jgi:DNA primase